MNSFKKSDKKVAIFIDFKSAFNTILRNKIYYYLREKRILDEDEILFL